MKTFDEISKDIPILKEVERICELVAMDKANQLERVWYKIIKPAIVDNVGFSSPYPEYKGHEEHDTVYAHLSKKLGC